MYLSFPLIGLYKLLYLLSVSRVLTDGIKKKYKIRKSSHAYFWIGIFLFDGHSAEYCTSLKTTISNR